MTKGWVYVANPCGEKVRNPEILTLALAGAAANPLTGRAVARVGRAFDDGPEPGAIGATKKEKATMAKKKSGGKKGKGRKTGSKGSKKERKMAKKTGGKKGKGRKTGGKKGKGRKTSKRPSRSITVRKDSVTVPVRKGAGIILKNPLRLENAGWFSGGAAAVTVPLALVGAEVLGKQITGKEVTVTKADGTTEKIKATNPRGIATYVAQAVIGGGAGAALLASESTRALGRDVLVATGSVLVYRGIGEAMRRWRRSRAEAEGKQVARGQRSTRAGFSSVDLAELDLAAALGEVSAIDGEPVGVLVEDDEPVGVLVDDDESVGVLVDDSEVSGVGQDDDDDDEDLEGFGDEDEDDDDEDLEGFGDEEETAAQMVADADENPYG